MIQGKLGSLKNEKKLPLLKLEKVKNIFEDNESNITISNSFNADEIFQPSSDSSSNFTSNLSVPGEPELTNSKSISNKYDDLSVNQIKNRMLKHNCFSMVYNDYEVDGETSSRVKHSNSQINLDEYLKNLTKYDFIVSNSDKKINLIKEKSNQNTLLIKDNYKPSKKIIEKIKSNIYSGSSHNIQTKELKDKDVTEKIENNKTDNKETKLVLNEIHNDNILKKNKFEDISAQKNEEIQKVISDDKPIINNNMLNNISFEVEKEEKKLENNILNNSGLSLETEKPSIVLIMKGENNTNEIENISTKELCNSPTAKSENKQIENKESITLSPEKAIVKSIDEENKERSDLSNNPNDGQTIVIEEKSQECTFNIKDKLDLDELTPKNKINIESKVEKSEKMTNNGSVFNEKLREGENMENTKIVQPVEEINKVGMNLGNKLNQKNISKIEDECVVYLKEKCLLVSELKNDNKTNSANECISKNSETIQHYLKNDKEPNENHEISLNDEVDIRSGEKKEYDNTEVANEGFSFNVIEEHHSNSDSGFKNKNVSSSENKNIKLKEEFNENIALGELKFEDKLRLKVDQKFKENPIINSVIKEDNGINIEISNEFTENKDKFQSGLESKLGEENSENDVCEQYCEFDAKTVEKKDLELKKMPGFISKNSIKTQNEQRNLKRDDIVKQEIEDELIEEKPRFAAKLLIDELQKSKNVRTNAHKNDTAKACRSDKHDSKISEKHQTDDISECPKNDHELEIKLKVQPKKKGEQLNYLKKQETTNELKLGIEVVSQIRREKSGFLQEDKINKYECETTKNESIPEKINNFNMKNIKNFNDLKIKKEARYSEGKHTYSQLLKTVHNEVFNKNEKHESMSVEKNIEDKNYKYQSYKRSETLKNESKSGYKDELSGNKAKETNITKLKTSYVQSDEKNFISCPKKQITEKSIQTAKLNNESSLDNKYYTKLLSKNNIITTKSESKEILKSKWSELLKSHNENRAKVLQNKKNIEVENIKSKKIAQLNKNQDFVTSINIKNKGYLSSGPTLKKIFTLDECNDSYFVAKESNQETESSNETKKINLNESKETGKHGFIDKKSLLSQKRRVSLRNHLAVPVIQIRHRRPYINAVVDNIYTTSLEKQDEKDSIFTRLGCLYDKFQQFFKINGENNRTDFSNIIEGKLSDDIEHLEIKPFKSKYSYENTNMLPIDNSNNGSIYLEQNNHYNLKGCFQRFENKYSNNTLLEVEKLLSSDFSSIETKKKTDARTSNINQNTIRKSTNKNKVSRKIVNRNTHNPVDLKLIVKKQEHIQKKNLTNKNLKINLVENNPQLNRLKTQTNVVNTKVHGNKYLENTSSVSHSSIGKYKDTYVKSRIKRNFGKIINNLDSRLIDREINASVCSCHVCSLHNNSDNRIDPITLHILREEMKLNSQQYKQITDQNEKSNNFNNFPKHYHKHYHYGGDKSIKLMNDRRYHCKHKCRHKHKHKVEKDTKKKIRDALVNKEIKANNTEFRNVVKDGSKISLLKEQIELILKEQGIIGSVNRKEDHNSSIITLETKNLSRSECVSKNKEDEIIRILKENYDKEYKVLQDISRSLNYLRISNNDLIDKSTKHKTKELGKLSEVAVDNKNSVIQSEKRNHSVNIENEIIKRNMIHMRQDFEKIRRNIIYERPKYLIQRRNTKNMYGLNRRKSPQSVSFSSKCGHNENVNNTNSYRDTGTKSVKKSISKSSKQQSTIKSEETSNSWFSGWFSLSSTEEQKRDVPTESKLDNNNSNSDSYSDTKATKATSDGRDSLNLENPDCNNSSNLAVEQSKNEGGTFWSWLGYTENTVKDEPKPKAFKETQKNISKTNQQKLKRKQSNKLSKQQASPPPPVPCPKPNVEETSWFSGWFGGYATETPPPPPSTPTATKSTNKNSKSKAKKERIRKPPPLKPVEDTPHEPIDQSVKAGDIKKNEPISVINVPPSTPIGVSWFSSWFGDGAEVNQGEVIESQKKKNDDESEEKLVSSAENNDESAKHREKKATSLSKIPSIKITAVVPKESLGDDGNQECEQGSSWFSSWFGGTADKINAPPPTPVNNTSAEQSGETLQEETSWLTSWFTPTSVDSPPHETRQQSPLNKETKSNEISKAVFQPDTKQLGKKSLEVQGDKELNLHVVDGSQSKGKKSLVPPESATKTSQDFPDRSEKPAEESSWFSGWFGTSAETTPAPPPTPTVESYQQHTEESSSWLDLFGGVTSSASPTLSPPPPPTPVSGTSPADESSWLSVFGW